MINFKEILVNCQNKTFCELMNEFYNGKTVEVYCGDISEEITFDQVSTRKPGILVGTIVGGHGSVLVIEAKNPRSDVGGKIVCLQEICIIMVTERDGEALDSYFIPTQNARKIKATK